MPMDAARTAQLCLIIAFAMAACGCTETCANSVVASVASPDGAHRAVVFQRDCGATTGFSTQISVTDDSGPPTDGGNAFIADDDHGAATSGAWGGPWADARWLSADHLLIRYAARSRLFHRQPSVSGIRISFESIEM